jgi:transposase-like protein
LFIAKLLLAGPSGPDSLPGVCFISPVQICGATSQRFPNIVATWRRAWDRVIPFFAFPPAVRKLIYTTNAIESLHSQLRKIIKTRGHFPNDDAATKLIWLALRNISANHGRSVREWREAMNQFAILYEERFTEPADAAR